MATGRLPIVQTAQPAASLSSQRLPVNQISHKNTTGLAYSRPIAQSVAEVDQQGPQREPIRQALFQKKCNDTLKLPNGYLNVAVLIIRWDESIDDLPGHTEEVGNKTEI
jgi:hypothetical protein